MSEWRRALFVGALILPMAGGFAAAEVPMPQPAPKAKARTPEGQAATATPLPGVRIAQNQPSTAGVPLGRPSAGKGRTGPLDAQQRAQVERINSYLSSVQTLVGDFVQVGPDGSKTAGKFYLQKPGRMRFEYNDPSPLELIADGRSVAIRDRRLATQDLLLLSQTPLRFLLSDRVDLIKEGNLINVQSDDVFVTITLEEKQTLGGTHKLMLMFNTQDLQLKQWTVTDPQGYDTTVALYNIDSSKRPDPGLFKINYERFRD